MAFAEIIITVDDVDAAVAFYTETCGFAFVRTVSADAGPVAELDADGQRITLIPGAGPGVTLVLESPDARAEYRRLNRRGVAVPDGGPLQVEGGALLPFADPTGNPLAYWQPGD
jgi:catechol 2,3-dioxygenase-like lactoylglutathione lyase family enzyme